MNRREFIKSSIGLAAVVALPMATMISPEHKKIVQPVSYVDNIANLYGITRRPAALFSLAENDVELRARCMSIHKLHTSRLR